MESHRIVVIIPSDPALSALVAKRIGGVARKMVFQAATSDEARVFLGRDMPALAVVEAAQAASFRTAFARLPVPILVVGEGGASFDAAGLAASIPAGLIGRSDNLFDLLAGTMIELGRQRHTRVLLESVVDAIEERIWITDAAGRIVGDNRAFREVWGKRPAELNHDTLWVDPREAGQLRLTALGSDSRDSSRETLHHDPSGGTSAVKVRCAILGEAGDAGAHAVWTARDISREKRLDAVLNRLSGLDLITGLPDERRFREALNLEWRRAMRSGQHLAVLLIDPDNFRGYNERYGRKAGDRCLTLIAGLLAGAPRRPGDLTARLGGAAIGIVLTGADTEAAVKFGARLREQVRGLGIPHTPGQAADVVTISVGAAAELAQEMDRPIDLVGRASEALLAAKSGGGDQIMFHDGSTTRPLDLPAG